MYTVENFILGLQKVWPNFIIAQVPEERISIIHEYHPWNAPETLVRETIAEIPISELNEGISSLPAELVATNFLFTIALLVKFWYNQTERELR